MTKRNQVWTNEEIERLISLKDSGHDFNHIASVLNRSYEACRKKLQCLRKEIATGSSNPFENTSINRHGKDWSIEDLELLYNFRKDGTPFSLIATELSRTTRDCENKYKSTDWKSLGIHDEREERFQKLDENKLSDYREKLLRTADRRFHYNKMDLDLVCDRIERSAKSVKRIEPPKYTPKSTEKRKQEDAVLMLSDIHFGANFTYEDTGGIAEFSFEKACSRLDSLKYSVRDIYELHTQMYDIPTLNICALGDFVAGDNSSGEWSQNYIKEVIAEQIIDGAEKIIELISYWLTIFEKINFYGISGNHGRTGKKGVEKWYNNYDYIAYRYIARVFKDNPRINFVVPKSWWIKTSIRDWKFLLVHGDDIRGGTFPVKKIKDFELQMAGIIKDITNYTLVGHFHNTAEITTNQGRILLNGSVIGGDMYSIKQIHANSRPEQTFFGVNNSHGITWKYNIDLDV